MTATEDILTEILQGQNSQFFYAHRNPQSSVPFESPEGNAYDIDLAEVSQITHNEDESFSVDMSKAWRFEDESGNIFGFCDNEDGSLTLVSCANAHKEITVPSSINGKPVTAIAFFAFSDCSSLEALVCPESANRIHSNAFKNCGSLQKLVLPKLSDNINRAWFKTLKQLKHLVLPDNLAVISSKVFVSIDLDYLHIGTNTESIESGAFNFSTIGQVEISPDNDELSTDGECIFKSGQSTLVSYYGSSEHYSIPAGCTRIESNAFAYNKTLRTVGMPYSLRSIGSYAFSNSVLEEFIAPKDLIEIQEKAFYFCSHMSRVILNDGLETIGKEAFFKAPIKELYIPESVTDIQSHAFYNTDAAMADVEDSEGAARPFGIQMSPESITFFIDAQGGLYQHMTAGRKSSGEAASQGRHREGGPDQESGLVFMEMLSLKAREYTLDPATTEIASGAFLRHPYIEKVTLPEGLKSIGDSAFRGCKSLSDINFPETLESIGKEAFVETVIKEAYIPKSLVHLGEIALRSSGKGFSHWLPGLTTLEIHPENERFFIKEGVLFQRAGTNVSDKGAADADTEDANPTGTIYALQYIGPNESVHIPDGCTRIMPYAFAGISSIKKIFLPASIEHIGYSGLMFEDAPEEVTIELKEPYEGHSSVTAYFSREGIGNQSIRKAFAPPKLDLPNIFTYGDRAIIHTHNFFTRAKLSIERLMDPVYATPDVIDLFQSTFIKELPRACREFAHNDFAKGFDYLIKLGYITKDNMTDIIEKVSETNDVAMIGYLLELKHRNFPSSTSLNLDL